MMKLLIAALLFFFITLPLFCAFVMIWILFKLIGAIVAAAST